MPICGPRLEKIVRRAGLEPWPRLWHSMRASCETDLARQFPLAVVAKWLGNTQAVAMRHYVDVTDADFERAVIERARSRRQKRRKKRRSRRTQWSRSESQPTRAAHEKTPALQGSASSCETLQNRGVEAAGIEPASRDISTKASTCVVGALHFAAWSFTSRLPGQLAGNFFNRERTRRDSRRFGFGDRLLGLSD